MNIKELKSKLFDDISKDFNKNKDAYLFYLYPLIFKIKTKQFNENCYSLFSKIKKEKIKKFDFYNIKNYLKNDYINDIKIILKALFLSSYLTKTNEYALNYIKKLTKKPSIMNYINLIYRLLSNIKDSKKGGFNITGLNGKSLFQTIENEGRKALIEKAFQVGDKIKNKATGLYYDYKYYKLKLLEKIDKLKQYTNRSEIIRYFKDIIKDIIKDFSLQEEIIDKIYQNLNSIDFNKILNLLKNASTQTMNTIESEIYNYMQNLSLDNKIIIIELFIELQKVSNKFNYKDGGNNLLLKEKYNKISKKPIKLRNHKLRSLIKNIYKEIKTLSLN